MFAFTDTRGPVEVAFTDRHGGVSGGPYASLDLGDRPDLAANLGRVCTGLAGTAGSAPHPVLIRQVHGSDVRVLDADRAEDLDRDAGMTVLADQADGIVTDATSLVLVVRVADCAPVLLADVAMGVVGAVHAGRPGMVAGVVPNAVATLRRLGCDRLVAWIGPHVCGSCYEVPAQMRADVTATVPESFAETSWGTPAVDIGAGVAAQLRAAGVTEIVDVGRCTLEDEDLYSYRRQGADSGRLVGAIWVRQ